MQGCAAAQSTQPLKPLILFSFPKVIHNTVQFALCDFAQRFRLLNAVIFYLRFTNNCVVIFQDCVSHQGDQLRHDGVAERHQLRLALGDVDAYPFESVFPGAVQPRGNPISAVTHPGFNWAFVVSRPPSASITMNL